MRLELEQVTSTGPLGSLDMKQEGGDKTFMFASISSRIDHNLDGIWIVHTRQKMRILSIATGDLGMVTSPN